MPVCIQLLRQIAGNLGGENFGLRGFHFFRQVVGQFIGAWIDSRSFNNIPKNPLVVILQLISFLSTK